MPEKIQRIPRGLADLLSLQSGLSPVELEDRVRGVIDITQLYGWTQRAMFQFPSAAFAENVPAVIAMPGRWIILFGVSATFAKTATLTALRGNIWLAGYAGTGQIYASEELGPFGATETGNAIVTFVPPYPMILPPTLSIFANASIIGTDATVNIAVSADVGVLG